ncbi:MAG TPA: Ppx/GppA phosphatase family protein [Propionicimonas sp.]|nr:Ppx/GppA phosphatase family protein [Propionicimonas sp.]HRA06288.1 Ppx/GppA phosphatase family protein [Propionicimonas sp.]
MAELFAAVDCGTNSVRLLIAQVIDGDLHEVDRRLHITRLGQGVDATGAFHPEALARTLDAMADFGAQLDALGVQHRRVVATSAARDAANSAEFFSGANARLGVPAEIISGEEEAGLSYAGAVAALPHLAQPVLVMDIGGGSTELVVGADGVARSAVSLNIGSVRLRESHLHSDPPSQEEIAAASDRIDGVLDSSGIDFAGIATWVGVGGTVTSLSALAQQLPVYDRRLVHASVVSSDALASLTRSLLAMPVAEVTELPTMVPGRADVICAGALICSRVGARVPAELVVSEADILDGVIARLANSAQM